MGRPQRPAGGLGAQAARPAGRGTRIGIRAAPPCASAPFPACGAARGQWRIVRRDTPGGAAPSGLGAALPRFACAPVTKVQGQELRAAQPRPAQALFFARRREFLAARARAAPAREWPSAAAV